MHRGMAGRVCAGAALALASLLGAPASGLAAGPAVEFPLPTSGSGPTAITAGPDGNLWFTEATANRIGRITPSGVVTEFFTGISPSANLHGITAGPDGNLWFTEFGPDKVGRITPAGDVTEFSTDIDSGADPIGITTGSDGNLWFAELDKGQIGRITPAGIVTEFGAGAFPNGITPGPDGNLWDTSYSSGYIGRIDITGAPHKEFTGIMAPVGTLEGIAAGPDGNLWFTEHTGSRIGKINTAGVLQEFPLPTAGQPYRITAGPDGNLWFTEVAGDKIGRITPAGTIDEFSSGITAGAHPNGITAGPDGNLWFTEPGGNAIGRIDTDDPAPVAGNLLRNPGFDQGTPGLSRAVTVPVLGWVTVPNFTEGLYGGTDLPGTALADQIGGGRGFGWGGAHSPDQSHALQVVAVGRERAAIDDGRASATLSGLLGGQAGQNDNAKVNALFLSASGDELASAQIGPVTPAELGNQTLLVPRTTSAPVPPGTRSVRVVATATNIGGGSDNGYFDNLSLTLDVTPAPVVAGAGGTTPGGTGPGGTTPGGTGPGAQANPADTTSPTFLAARLTAKAFAVDTHGSAETAVTARVKKVKKGTSFVYTLSEASRVLFAIEQMQKGRKVGGKCQKPSKKNKAKKRCTRYVKIGTFGQDGTAGSNTKAFSGKIGRRALRPGSYRATIGASDAAGNKSQLKRLNFKVVRH
jgi:streptogramin lyase